MRKWPTNVIIMQVANKIKLFFVKSTHSSIKQTLMKIFNLSSTN